MLNAKMAKYTAYKDSEEDWLGEVPTNWEVKTVKAIFQERKEKNNPVKTKDILSLCMYRGVIPYAEKGAAGNKAKEDLTAYRLAYPGDIVMNSMNVVAGSVGLSKYFGAVSPVYYMLRPRKEEDSVEYFNAIFRNEAFQKSLVGLGNGILVKKSESTGKLNTIRMRIPMSKMNMVKMPYPSPAEQTAIAAFLDKKTAHIDAAVGIKQKQIALLKERKQILIQNAVTRGLNPNAPMRDSGVEWIGKIPAHWEVKRLASFGFFSKGGGFSKSDLVEHGVAAVLYGDIYTKYEYVIDKISRHIPLSVANRAVRLRRGDILFTGSGETKEDIGKCVVFDSSQKAVAGGDVIIFKQNENHNIFLSYCLNTYGVASEKAKSSKGEIIVHTYASKLRSLYIPIPPLKEQTAIVAHIEKESAKIDQAIALNQQQIDKLKEYKATLINSAVTGKIKVV